MDYNLGTKTCTFVPVFSELNSVHDSARPTTPAKKVSYPGHLSPQLVPAK